MREEPQNTDAEKSLLGSILLNANALDDVEGIVTSDDFYDHRNRKIYSLAQEIRQDNRAIDAVTIAELASKRGELPDIGQMFYLSEVMETVPHASHADYYAEIVAQKSRLRSILSACRIAMEAVYQGGEDPAIIADAETSLHAILERTAQNEAVDIRKALEGAFAHLDSFDPPGIPMGLEKLDELYQLQPGNLIVVGARPAIGKTGLAVNIAINVAKKGYPCYFFSLEQTVLEITQRFLSSFSGVPSLKLQKMEPISERERLQALSSASERAGLPIWIDDDPGTISRIAAKCRLWKRKHNLGVVIVDYIQLIEPESRKESREQQVAVISRSLKKLATQLKIPVICLAQLNRKSEDRLDRKPRLADLRESGSLEQDANCVILIHRSDDRPGVAELIVAKNRNGRTGMALVQFDDATVTFRDLAPQYQNGWPEQ